MTNSLLDAKPGAPAYLHVPAAASSAGQEAVELAASAGLELDPWQIEVLHHALGERDDGQWAAFSVGLVVPRQNGKGAILEALELACLFLFEDELVIHSAHQFKTASEHFLRITSLIESTPDLDRYVRQIYRGHGNESIDLVTGQRLKFVARSGGSGRGFSGDKVILDEAYNLPDKAIAALLPTLATLPNPQLWYASSAPLDTDESAVLRRLVRRGRGGESADFAYIEYSAQAGDDLDDAETWAKSNPGLDVRISREFVGRERGEMEDDDFARERCGIYDDVDEISLVIPLPQWRACESNSMTTGTPRVAVDVSPDRSWSSIAVAGDSSAGGRQVELVEHEPGTAWVRAVLLKAQGQGLGPVAIAKNSPAWSLRTELTDAGVDLLEVEPSEHAQACGMFYDAVLEGTVHHLVDAVLDKAVRGADRRFSGDSWMWSRRSSTVDISPLVAATLALWAHAQAVESVYEGRGLVTL